MLWFVEVSMVTKSHRKRNYGQELQTNTSVSLNSSVKSDVGISQPGLSKENRANRHRMCLYLCSTSLPVCEVFTCNCLYSGEQRKFLSSPQPARPSLPDSLRAPEHQPNHSRADSNRAISMTAHVRTSIGAAQEIPELHVGGRYAEERTSAQPKTPVYIPLLCLHFLVVLYAVTYRRRKTPPTDCFRLTHLGAESQFKHLLPSPKLSILWVCSHPRVFILVEVTEEQPKRTDRKTKSRQVIS